MRPVIRFDINQIPTGARIEKATLYIYQRSSHPSNDTDIGFKISAMTQPWNEYSVTWNSASGYGGDDIVVDYYSNALGWKTTDITSLVLSWYELSRENFGIMITADESPQNNRYRLFRTKQWAGYEPYILIDYTDCSDQEKPTATVLPLPQWVNGEFQVRWEGTDDGSGIAFYDIQYNLNAGSWIDWKINTNEISATFGDIINGQEYEFRARATDHCDNTSTWTEAQAITKVDLIKPSSALTLLETYTYTSTFDVTWNGSDNAGGSGIADYDIQLRVNEAEWQDWMLDTVLTSGKITGATQGERYEFRARVVDHAGNQEPYPEASETNTTVVLYSVADVVPFTPFPFTDQLSFDVSWIGFPLGATITQYDIRYRFDGGSWLSWDSFTGTSAHFDLVDPNLDGLYEFEVRAINDIGQIEPWSEIAEASIYVDRHPPFFQISNYLPLILSSS